jgi:hypothetical protein
MAVLVPAVHVFLADAPLEKTWTPATSAGMRAETRGSEATAPMVSNTAA